MDSCARTIASFACLSRRSLLHPISFASPALDQRCNSDILTHAFGRIHERNVCLDFNILADQDLFLKRSTSSPATASAAGKGAKQIFKIELGTEPSAEPGEWISSTRTCERMSTTRRGRVEASALVECSSAKLIVCGLFLGVVQKFVC
jgi:hypothetical protein